MIGCESDNDSPLHERKSIPINLSYSHASLAWLFLQYPVQNLQHNGHSFIA